MQFTYYSNRLGRERLKRRYVWGFLGFAGGTLFGMAVIWLL